MLNQRAKMFVLIMHEDLRGLCGVAVSIIHCKICIIQKFSQNSTKPTKIRWNCTRNTSTFPRVPVFHLKYYTEYSGNKDNTDLYGNLCEYSPKMRSFSYLENIFLTISNCLFQRLIPPVRKEPNWNRIFSKYSGYIPHMEII